jgi:hypothetical protein
VVPYLVFHFTMIDLENAFKRKPRRIPASVKALDDLQLSSDSDGNIVQGRLNNPPTNSYRLSVSVHRADRRGTQIRRPLDGQFNNEQM